MEYADLHGSNSSLSTTTTSATTCGGDTHHHPDFNSSFSSLSTSLSTRSSSTSSRSPSKQSGDVVLPADYTPSDADVICARGRSGWDHPGNVFYRNLIEEATPRYSQTTNKLEKTLIVSEIAHSVHSRKGKFIKRKNKRCPWVEVEETFHREKIGQSLRDSTTAMRFSSKQYKSATSVKKQHRQCHTKDTNCKIFGGDTVDSVVRSNVSVSHRMDELHEQIQRLSCSSSSNNWRSNKREWDTTIEPISIHDIAESNCDHSNYANRSSNIFDADRNVFDSQVNSQPSSVYEHSMMTLFSNTNSAILETLKHDASMHNLYEQHATRKGAGDPFAFTAAGSCTKAAADNWYATMDGHYYNET
jgi:hypothetical protein